ncbi:hypothetical protein N617_gp06 [Stygiolobus rod-shaped virus]|uniref:Uncharacterized protein n=1 Tax=Stygiolobus rod-shaped virus TaxID=537009 RepID=B6EFB2_9VIRU|nr:hypothetical protein N617_gp06 [Stygiolobus rod-shaped virus]CAQ58447.1 hypothetical protein [Stygiolobus rod-shaped virus]
MAFPDYRQFDYVYFITIEKNNTRQVFKRLNVILRDFDRNCKIRSVYNEKKDHYHILFFTNKRLDYKKLHEKMKMPHSINIEIVNKTKEDIEKIKKYMTLNKLGF